VAFQIRKYKLQENPNEYGRQTRVGYGDILLVAEQYGILHAWIMVNDSVDTTQVLNVFATGEYIDHNSHTHVGSALVGSFVWHVFKQV